MMTAKNSIQFGNSLIQYQAIRRPARKTFSIVMDYEDGVIVLAPSDANDHEISALVRKKASWILKQKHGVGFLAKHYERRFISGESYPYLGRYYQLQLTEASIEENYYVGLFQGRFLIAAPKNLNNEDKKSWIKTGLHDWYVRKAEEKLPEIAGRWACRIGVSPNNIYIRDQKKRWGSCDTRGNLRLNWRLIMSSASLIEYVIVHELCHLIHKNHTEEFWRTLKAVMPDYENRVYRLKQQGPLFSL